MSITSPFTTMRAPVGELLSRHGLKYKISVKGAGTWYNLAACPICGHNGHQCGVVESAGTDGKLVHAVKCQHTDSPRYEDFLHMIGALTAAEASQVKNFVPRDQAKKAAQQGTPQSQGASNVGHWHKEYGARVVKRLHETPDALIYLLNRGLKAETIKHFLMGLSLPQTNTEVFREKALTVPVFNSEGLPTNKNMYYNIPCVSVNPIDENGWMSGEIRTYYGSAVEGRRIVFVCEGAKDLWRTWQEFNGTGFADSILLISSTHGTNFPREWKLAEFWEKWDLIYFGHDNDTPGEKLSVKLAEHVGRDVFRVRPPAGKGKDWTDYWQAGGTLDEFDKLMGMAPVVSRPLGENLPGTGLGRLSYKPIDVNQAYHNGFFYYPVEVLCREEVEVKNEGTEDSSMEILEKTEVVVVRSDGVVLHTIKTKAQKGTPEDRRVLRLSDGTLISREPKSNTFASWGWDSIDRFTRMKQAGLQIRVRPVGEMLDVIIDYLKSKIWLPFADDYTILALAAVATYVQAVFEAVPLLMVNGEKGSGKSELAIAMAAVSANSHVIGQGSAASIARFIDETRGFIALDDIESLGNKDSQFSDLAQALKLSYKKSTAVKLWTDVKTMKVEKLNFFGIKMVNNTGGVGTILGSRMMHIKTRKRTAAEIAAMVHIKKSVLNTGALRDDLHTWAFSNVALVASEYERLYPQNSDRAEEIAAPLRVVASLTGNPVLLASLESALQRQHVEEGESDEPEDILYEALRRLLVQGFREISASHLSMEIQTLVPDNYGKRSTTEIPVWEQPEWVNRKARAHGWIESEGVRKRLWDTHLRFHKITQYFIDLVAQELGSLPDLTPRDSTSFCEGCETCQYRGTKCTIMPKRTALEATHLKKVSTRLRAVGVR
jgi:hypothetical protein